jgi:hypothetical protein
MTKPRLSAREKRRDVVDRQSPAKQRPGCQPIIPIDETESGGKPLFANGGFMRKAFSMPLAALALLAGCSSGTSQGSMSPESPTVSRLVFYRPSALPMALDTPTVKINGAPTCGIANGGGFQKDISPGAVTISTAVWSMPGTSSLSFTASPGQIYYVRFGLSSNTTWATVGGATGGLLGAGIAYAVEKPSGPFAIELTDASSLNGISPRICDR